MTTTAELPTTREEILKAISDCEARLIALRSRLPSCIKTFFRFRGTPFRYLWVYAASREEGEKKAFDRLAADYGPDGFKMHRAVETYADAAAAAANSQGNLLKCLSRDDAREFLKDWDANKQGRAVDPDRPKHLPASGIERDVEAFRRFLLANENRQPVSA